MLPYYLPLPFINTSITVIVGLGRRKKRHQICQLNVTLNYIAYNELRIMSVQGAVWT